MIDTSGDLNLSTEYYSLLIVNARNERRGNCTATKGRGSGWSNFDDKVKTEMYSTCETEIEYVCVGARDNDACEGRQMKLYHAM